MSDKTTKCVWNFIECGSNKVSASTTCGAAFMPNRLDLVISGFYTFCPCCGREVEIRGLDNILDKKTTASDIYSKERLQEVFSDFICKRRAEERMSVKEFSNAYGISLVSVYNYEKRACLPSVTELLKLSHSLNTSVYEMFSIPQPTGDDSDE